MTLVAVLIGVGILLLAAEVVVPGGVLGVVGGLFLFAGVAVAFVQRGPAAGFGALAVGLVAGGLTLTLEFYILPRSRLVRSLSMSETVAGTSHTLAVSPAALIGCSAISQTKLVPSGYVLVNGRRFEAISRDGLVEAGASLRVVGVDNFRLTVAKNPS